MKSTGIVQTVNGVGKVLIPKIIGKAFEIEKNSMVEILSSDDKIYLKKLECGCVFCGDETIVKIYKGKKICNNCQNEIKRISKS